MRGAQTRAVRSASHPPFRIDGSAPRPRKSGAMQGAMEILPARAHFRRRHLPPPRCCPLIPVTASTSLIIAWLPPRWPLRPTGNGLGHGLREPGPRRVSSFDVRCPMLRRPTGSPPLAPARAPPPHALVPACSFVFPHTSCHAGIPARMTGGFAL